MATLFGLVMLTHQIGGFLGAWLGGQVFEATGNYDLIWIIDIALAVGAALIHCRSARRLRRPAWPASRPDNAGRTAGRRMTGVCWGHALN
jgi:hypothetical protein